MRLLLTFFIGLVGTKVFAYDIKVENQDGVTIYYNYINHGKELEVTYYGGNVYRGSVNIPEEVTHLGVSRKVTSIQAGAFDECEELTYVTIPATVKVIDGCAFADCRGLTSITIPNGVEKIGYHCFYGCTGLKSITIPKSTYFIEAGILAGCSSIETISVDKANKTYDSRDNCNAIIKTNTNELIAGCKNTIIPNNVVSINSYAFQRNQALTTISIPNSVLEIGYEAFSGCENLSSISIREGVTKIDEYAFNKCTSLVNLTIPNGVVSIKMGAFRDCSNLFSIYFGNSLVTIGAVAFEGCSSLNDITFTSDVGYGYHAFDRCNNITTVVSTCKNPSDGGVFTRDTYNNAVLYVPVGTTNLYKNIYSWGQFNHIVEVIPDNIDPDTPAVTPGQGDTPDQGNVIKAIKLEFDGTSMTIQLSQQPKIVMEYGYVVIKTSNKSITLSLPCRATFVDATATTAIDDVVVRNNDETKPFSVFTINGRKVGILKDRKEALSLRRGIYIINGKKVLVK